GKSNAVVVPVDDLQLLSGQRTGTFFLSMEDIEARRIPVSIGLMASHHMKKDEGRMRHWLESSELRSKPRNQVGIVCVAKVRESRVDHIVVRERCRIGFHCDRRDGILREAESLLIRYPDCPVSAL